MNHTESRFCLRATSYGPVAAVWSFERAKANVWRILLSKPGLPAGQRVRRNYPSATPASCPEVSLLLDRIAGFLDGADVRFSLSEIRLDVCSTFQQKVLRAEHGIPRGRVSTYCLIAAKLGHAKAARAVGTALATNPFPIVIPCHRAVRSDGSLGGYQGGLKMKRELLKREGIAFRDAEHVAPMVFFYSRLRFP